VDHMARREDDRTAYLAGEDFASLSPAERAELDEVRSLLGSPATWEQPDPALENRVVAAIAEQVADRPASARARKRWALPSLRVGRPLYAFAGAAAAVAVAIAVAISVNTSSPAPRQFAMVVAGTPLAPTAHGSATLTKTDSGWRIALSASGLPHVTGGAFYEAWLKNARGVLVPVGTFNDARHVTLWAGVPPTEFPTLTVTRQRANGNPSSSGQRVLGGTITASR
jgi:Anti-sigma-K factor rskA